MNSTIFTFSHNDLLKRLHIQSVVLSLLMILLGILAFVSILNMDDKSSTLSMCCLVFGSILLLSGVFRLFWRSHQFVFAPTGSPVKEHVVFLDAAGLDSLQQAIQRDHFESVGQLATFSSGNVRMNAVVSEDGRFIAFQLFQYVPYTYQSVTSVCYYTEEKARQLAALFLHS